MHQTSQKETATDRLAQDYILCSYLWNGTTKDTSILMDTLSSNTPKTQVKVIDDQEIEIGVIEHWENEVDGLKDDQDGLNEFIDNFHEQRNMHSETKQKNLYLI